MSRRELVRVAAPPPDDRFPPFGLPRFFGFGVLWDSGLDFVSLGRGWVDRHGRHHFFSAAAEESWSQAREEVMHLMLHGVPGIPGPFAGRAWIGSSEGRLEHYQLRSVGTDDERPPLPDAVGKVIPIDTARERRRKVA